MPSLRRRKSIACDKKKNNRHSSPSSLKWLPHIIGKSIVTIRMQDESELLLPELDNDYIGVHDDSNASVAAASRAGEPEEPSSNEDAPAAWRVDLGASIVHQ